MGHYQNNSSVNQNNSALTEAPLKIKRNLWGALKAGFKGRCPACKTGNLFERFLRINHHCEACGEELHHHRADDAPPYFTIFIVGHIVVPLLLAVEIAFMPALWIHALVWGPLIFILTLLILPRIKGALVGYQWALYMHGFDPVDYGNRDLATKVL